MNLSTLSAPSPIDVTCDLEDFNSGEASLDEWLRKRALANEQSSASRTYVVCEGKKAAGYYCLSAGGITHCEVPKAMRRNMPDPIPVMVLGRLAVDKRYQDMGLGKALLLDATRRTLQISKATGVAALLVHALSEPAKRFYLSRGFIESPIKPMTLCLMLASARKALAEE